MSEDTLLEEKDNRAWIPRNRFPALMNVDKNDFNKTEFVSGDLKLTNSNIIFKDAKGQNSATIPLKLISSFTKKIIGQKGAYDGGVVWTRSVTFQKIEEPYICIILNENFQGRYFFEFRVSNPDQWIAGILNIMEGGLKKQKEINFKETGFKESDRQRRKREARKKEKKRIRKLAEEAMSEGGLDNYEEARVIYEKYPQYFGGIKKTIHLILEVKMKIAREYEISLEYNKAIEAYKELELPDDVIRVKKLVGDDKAKHLDYEKAIEIYESIGDKESAKNARKLKAEQGAVKVTQKVVHGDEVTKTEIKDSVLNRSNVGGKSSKAEELREAKALLDEGLINEDDYENMKKEILGK
jgi:hypothetical protein